MKILFICGSLEPGLDGVGDYTRRLGGELIRAGHQVSLLSLNDHYLQKATAELQETEGVMISVFRIPTLEGELERFRAAKEFVDANDPEWLSLQYVPFAFDAKGLPFGLAKKLSKVGVGRKWHIMFHELWVGTEAGRFLKLKMIGLLQQLIIRKMRNILRPTAIHTHLPLFKRKLDKAGGKVFELSLFSNIPRVECNHNKPVSNILRICFFSQVNSNIEVTDLLLNLEKKAIEKGQKLEILLLGGSEARMLSFKNEVSLLLHKSTTIIHTGFLSQEEISNHLLKCDVGVTTIPRHALGKSGSVAAFISHNVPVAAPVFGKGSSKKELSFFTPSLRASILETSDYTSIDSARKATYAAQEEIKVSTIANKFLFDLLTSCAQKEIHVKSTCE